jgi:hypothetical protein
MNSYFIPNLSDKKNDKAFGQIILHGQFIEQYIITEIVLWSGTITKKIFANNFYKKEQVFKSYWKKDTEPCIPFNEIRGGSCEPVPQICRDWVVDVINEFLTKNEDSIVLFEDIAFDCNEDIVKKSKLHYFKYNGKLYYFKTNSNSIPNLGYIESALSLIGHGFNDTIILTRYQDLAEIESITTGYYDKQDKIIDALINNAETVIFTAYDQQGYIAWEL